jgi:hypothetical protein
VRGTFRESEPVERALLPLPAKCGEREKGAIFAGAAVIAIIVK